MEGKGLKKIPGQGTARIGGVRRDFETTGVPRWSSAVSDDELSSIIGSNHYPSMYDDFELEESSVHPLDFT